MVSSTEGAFASFLLFLLYQVPFCECFTSKFHVPTSFVRRNFQSEVSVPLGRCLAKKGHSEYTVVDEDNEDDDATEVDFRQRQHGGGDLLVINEDATSSQSSASSHLEYAALRPGTVVQIQVGDLSLARKAWKKRRRTGSPLLVPCSIINVDRRSAVRWNIIFLLEKFGQAVKGNKAEIEMSLKDLAGVYRSYLKSSLGRQADALGFESSEDMFTELFSEKIQKSYGVFVKRKNSVEDGVTTTMLYLTTPISRRKAQLRTTNAAMLQFRPPREGDYDDISAADTAISASLDEDAVHVDSTGTLTHTGWIRTLTEDKKIIGDGGERKLKRQYSNFPLSACLRVSQKDDINTGRVEEGKIFPAVLFDYDKIGDGGSPLLTLSLNTASGGRQRLKIKGDKQYKILEKPNYHFNELSAGDGPYRAKVIKLLGKEQKALVDLGVGRELATAGGKPVQVLGSLRFKDSVELVEDNNALQPVIEFDDEDDEDIDDIISLSLDELDALDEDDDEEEDIADELLSLRKGSLEPGTFEEGEEEEDISDLFTVNEEGHLVYKDPETGQTTMIEDNESEEETVMDAEEEEDKNSASDDDDISDKDMANLFTKNEDGSITYNDPETGETMTVSEGDEEFEDMMMMKSIIDDNLNIESDEEIITPPPEEPKKVPEVSNEKQKFKSKRLKVGETIEVYISAVSKQSNTFSVTTNPLVKGRKMKDIKKNNSARDALERLKKRFGGNFDRIHALKGTECQGIVKSPSKVGNWVYVQPELEDLPTGIGTFGDDELRGLEKGDNVRLRIIGIDEEKGKLSMEVIGRL